MSESGSRVQAMHRAAMSVQGYGNSHVEEIAGRKIQAVSVPNFRNGGRRIDWYVDGKRSSYAAVNALASGSPA